MEQLIGKPLGQYQIVQELGRGGMAVVYKAHQPALQRHVAIKVLPPQMGMDPGFVKRFQQEAVAAARLKHPHIVTIYDVGITDGVNYIVMEFIEGQPLSAIIRQSGAMPPERVAHIIGQVASALDYAHQQGFVHRDIKPSNIMLGAGDHATLTDFGIAKAMSGVRLTQTGALIGTPEYMSPEQVRGLAVDRRADIYSLGVVAYEMLSGQAPFSGDTASVLYKQANELPPPIRARVTNVPAHVANAVDRALAKDPDQRFATAGAFAQSLGGAAPTGSAQRAALASPPRNRKLIGAVIGVAALAVICAAVIGALAISASVGKTAVTPSAPKIVAQVTTVAPPSTLAAQSKATRGATATSSTPTRAVQPSDTPAPTRTFTPVPTRTPTPTLTPTPSCPPVTGPFADIWQSAKDKLGCATNAAHGSWVAEELFQKGQMFWRQDNDRIYALYNGDGWGTYPNEWREGDPGETCSSGAPITPVRGFGKTWCTAPGVRSGLGNATMPERGYNGTAQDFSRGLILRTDSGATYVMYSGDGWETR